MLLNSMLINYVITHQNTILSDYKRIIDRFPNLDSFISEYFKVVKCEECTNRENIKDSLHEYIRTRKSHIYNDISKGIINTKEDNIFIYSYLDFTTTEIENKRFIESLSVKKESAKKYFKSIDPYISYDDNVVIPGNVNFSFEDLKKAINNDINQPIFSANNAFELINDKKNKGYNIGIIEQLSSDEYMGNSKPKKLDNGNTTWE